MRILELEESGLARPAPLEDALLVVLDDADHRRLAPRRRRPELIALHGAHPPELRAVAEERVPRDVAAERRFLPSQELEPVPRFDFRVLLAARDLCRLLAALKQAEQARLPALPVARGRTCPLETALDGGEGARSVNLHRLEHGVERPTRHERFQEPAVQALAVDTGRKVEQVLELAVAVAHLEHGFERGLA